MVVECSCGMVMSISTNAPRAYCIRCGGIDFHVIGNLSGNSLRSHQPVGVDAGRERVGPLAFECAGYSIAAYIGDGSDI